MVEEYDVFANNLQYFMDKFGYTQLSLSEKIGLRNTTVSRWVNGETFPRVKALNKLCEVFCCTKADLVEIKQYNRTDSVIITLHELHVLLYKLNEQGLNKVIDYIKDLKEEFYYNK